MATEGNFTMFDLLGITEDAQQTAGTAEATNYSEYIVTEKIRSLEKEHTYKKPVGLLGAILKTVEKMLCGANPDGKYMEAVEKTASMYLKKVALQYLEGDDPNAKADLEDLLAWNVTDPEGISPLDISDRMYCQKKGGFPKMIHMGVQEFGNRAEYSLCLSVTGLRKYGKRYAFKHEKGTLIFKDLSDLALSAIARVIQNVMDEKNASAVIYRKVAENRLRDYCYDEAAAGHRIVVDAGIYDLEKVKEAFENLGLHNVAVTQSSIFASFANDNELDLKSFKCIDFRGSTLLAILLGEKLPISVSKKWYSKIDKDIISQILRMMAEEDLTEQRIERHRAVTTSMATCYMDKKNVPLKTVEAMNASPLHRYFGRIEYDALVDLELMEKLNKEIQAVIINFFDGLQTPDVAFRVRLLGKHKAIGIYWPTEKCLCIDVRDPSAFVHEYMHMFDHRNGELSRTYEFYGIRERYSLLLKEWHEEQSEFTKKKMKSSVYDLGYYLTPTEVFARCGEMYFNRIRGVSNSTLGSCQGFAYPNDEQLMNLIAAYFNGFFEGKGESICNKEVSDDVWSVA